MKGIAPQWIVEDMEKTIEFYQEKLDFTLDWVGDPPHFAMLSRAGVTLMFRALSQPQLMRPNRQPFVQAGWEPSGKQAWDAYVWVEDVEHLYQKCVERELSIIRELETTDYGNRDFDLEDINGYILCFGQTIAD